MKECVNLLNQENIKRINPTDLNAEDNWFINNALSQTEILQKAKERKAGLRVLLLLDNGGTKPGGIHYRKETVNITMVSRGELMTN